MCFISHFHHDRHSFDDKFHIFIIINENNQELIHAKRTLIYLE